MLGRCVFLLSLLLLFLQCMPVYPSSQIPEESLDALQNTFAGIRDHLWELNDEYWHHGDYDRCIKILRLITEVDPHDVEAYDCAAWLLQNQFRDDEAEKLLAKSIANNPLSSDAYFDLGFFYYMHERFSESIRYLETSAGFCEFDPAWHILAHAYELSGNTSESLNIWLRMESLEPDSNVPKMNIERIMRGDPPSDIPGFVSRSREKRKAESLESKSE